MATVSTLHIHGLGVSPGIAIGPAVLFHSKAVVTPMTSIKTGETDAEWKRFEDAVALTRKQIEAFRERLAASAGGESFIIDSHLMVLDDELYLGDIRKEVYESLKNAAWAVHVVTAKYIKQFSEFDNEMMRERADDILDVGRRIHANLLGAGEDPSGQWKHPCIVVAGHLTPSEALALPRDMVKGIALDSGSITSHAALVIRAIGIPAVFGLKSVTTMVDVGQTIAVDGSKGLVIVNPDAVDSNVLNDIAAKRQGILETFSKLRDVPAVTPDGFRVKLLANIENADDLPALDANGAEGIGLFRTEYLWLASGKPVSENDQCDIYRTTAKAMTGRPVVIRAFDLGGDKFARGAGLKKNEANPFLGLRSIRYLLKHQDVFKSQLRAIIKAGQCGDVRILIPMISVLDELIQVRQILSECVEQLMDDGIDCKMPKLGAMIEVPAAALQSRLLAKHVDFISIGSNDLVQYTMAADRINEHVAHLYQPANPAVLSLIEMTAQAARESGIPVCICGEMASNPILATLLLGMQIGAFSMASSSIPVIKAMISRVPLAAAQDLVKTAVVRGESKGVIDSCRLFLAEYAPEVLKLC